MKQNIVSPIDLTPNASGYLDILRSVAAMAVMFGHWRGLFFVDFEQIAPSSATVPVKAMYFLTGFGHQAVMVFFVLSGFLISSSVLRKLGRSTWSWGEYAIDRAVRLYLVLVPGLLLGGLLDIVGVRFFNQSEIYSVPLLPFGNAAVAQRLNISSFFGSLLFLQTRFTTVFGSNGPLWSLFNEFWYYVLFPVLMWVILSAKRHSVTVVIYIAVAIFAAWVLGEALLGFVVWLAGGSVALTSGNFRFPASRGWTVGLYTFCTATLVGICLFTARANRGRLGSDLAVGLSFALLMHGIVQLRVPLGALVLRVAKTFAGFSYSLYVLHFPLLLLVRAKWLPVNRWQPDEIHILIGIGIAAGVLSYAFAIANITERKTFVVRSWIRRKLAQLFRNPNTYGKLYQKANS